MNSEKVQTIINEIISEYGYPVRKQYPVAKWQIERLTELGIIELMPKEFGHGDAKAVIAAAEQGATAVMNAYGEGEAIGASELYKAIHEVVETSEPQTFIVSEDDNEIEIDGETFYVVVSNHIHGNITLEIDGGYGLADYEDGSQDYVEIDGNYQVAVLYDDIELALDDKEFEVTITPEMIADAKRYRANYPLDVESEF